MNAPAQVPSKKLDLIQRIDNSLMVLWIDRIPCEQRARELLREAADMLRAADEPPAECAGCEEFVRMQHDIASLLGVDEDTDSIGLHGRIYGALSARAGQPPLKAPGENNGEE